MSPAVHAAIEARGLTKYYDDRPVVRGLDWSLAPGTACALLGPNGAGKTTTLKMLMGFTPATSGEARVLGSDPWEMGPQTRARVGYVSERPVLPPWIRVGRLIRFHAGLYESWDGRLERELVERLGVPPQRRVGELSKGQNRSLMLLLALCQGADLLVLDEPASGLDVAARREFLRLLADYLAQGERTLLVSSHLLTDLERLVSHVAILHGGRLIESCALDDLKESVHLVRLPRELAPPLLARLAPEGLLAREDSERQCQLTIRLDGGGLEAVLDDLPRERVEVSGLALEDIYLALTGAAARDE